MFITGIVIMSSLIAFLYKQPIADNLIVLIALVVDLVVIVLLFRKIIKEINALEEIE